MMEFHSKNFDRFIMVAPGSDYGIAMWSDVKKVENAIFLDYVIDDKSSFLKKLHHIHFSFSINSHIRLPFQNLWKRVYSIEKCGISENERTCLIFTDISACRIDERYLETLYKLPNTTMVMVLVNVMSSKPKLIRRRLRFFDKVYSFDESDCTKYGFVYHPTFYSRTYENFAENEVTRDAFFIGASKGDRLKVLTELYHKIQEKDGKADFYISGVNDTYNQEAGIHYNQWMKYNQVLEQVLKSNCIVEIMGTEQSGLTLRAMEAIVYNRKLLTNNASIKKLRFFDSGHIKYFEKIQDDDIDFIIQREKVDYKYKDEFSPIRLLESIDKMMSE